MTTSDRKPAMTTSGNHPTDAVKTTTDSRKRSSFDSAGNGARKKKAYKKARSDDPDFETQQAAALKHMRDRRFSKDGKAPKMSKDQRERKRLINRLSAQRKREHERTQLDSLTRQYSKYSYLNTSLEADNKRLEHLKAKIQRIMASYKEKKQDQQGDDMFQVMVKRTEALGSLRSALMDCIGEIMPTPAACKDPLILGAEDVNTLPNPFARTTEALQEKAAHLDSVKPLLMRSVANNNNPAQQLTQQKQQHQLAQQLTQQQQQVSQGLPVAPFAAAGRPMPMNTASSSTAARGPFQFMAPSIANHHDPQRQRIMRMLSQAIGGTTSNAPSVSTQGPSLTNNVHHQPPQQQQQIMNIGADRILPLLANALAPQQQQQSAKLPQHPQQQQLQNFLFDQLLNNKNH